MGDFGENNTVLAESNTYSRLHARRLIQCLDKFGNVPIVVVGDLILDHYIWGRVDRISPEAPVVVVNMVEENKRLGGAGNVAHNLVSLGAKVTLCGVVGDDQNGRDFIGMMEAVGIDTSGVMVDRTRPTTVKTRVIAHGQQVVRVDREDASALSPVYHEALAAAVESQIPRSCGVLLSDYGKGTISEPLVKRISACAKDQGSGLQEEGQDGSRSAGRGCASRVSYPFLVDPKAPNFLTYKGATIIKPNRKEAQEASGLLIKDRQSAIIAGRSLLDIWDCDMVLITLGELGMVLVERGRVDNSAIEIETDALEVFDVSGAGDTVSATFGLALASGASPEDAAYLANYAAGIVVREVGTVAVRREQLLDRLRAAEQEN